MSKSRVNMYEPSGGGMPYVKIDYYVEYKPAKGIFNCYDRETGDSEELNGIEGAYITQRMSATGSSPNDKLPVRSQDFDNFNEKLFFRTLSTPSKLVLKDKTYKEVKESNILGSDFKLKSVFYIINKQGKVMAVTFSGMSRMRMNEILDNVEEEIDYVSISAEKETNFVGEGVTKKEIHYPKVDFSKQKYDREMISKINEVVQTLNDIKEYKKNPSVKDKENNEPTVDEASQIFDEVDDMI